MATPLSADAFVKALRAEGLTVTGIAGWRTHNRNHKGAWGGMNGVVIHHTAGRNSLALCRSGTSALPGPLCHTHLSKTGLATMVGYGRANHAGSFAQNAHNAVVNESSTHPRPSSSEPVDGNAHYYGIEIENLGNGTDFYPAKQYDAAVRWAAAICRAHGWSAQSVIGHKEGTTRKIDPKGPIGSKTGSAWDMDDFRADVQARLDAGKPSTSEPSTSKPATKPVVSVAHLNAARKKDIPAATGHTTYPTEVKVVEAALKAEGLLTSKYVDGSWGTLTQDAYNAFRRKVGYKGSAATGSVGLESLKKLAARHGFTAKA
ncbi:N-acetylmuramoyl-L-alanine amidase [Streptomyces sp. ISL-12]|uniref:N-acetylmuramoyl-L-alanine amidase n=1 Tax=Streptomyces sp. ISL-12 TaxID=2819177 RepID=UPI001BEC5442|nr:N-acetylmuramoyl-L-alanine amidase [Streptomyces sp. ISL-12]MBT2412645.1 N-acetylmuramoyl-L-alanine amidase [Streptomyces sp. ISL-12]